MVPLPSLISRWRRFTGSLHSLDHRDHSGVGSSPNIITIDEDSSAPRFSSKILAFTNFRKANLKGFMVETKAASAKTFRPTSCSAVEKVSCQILQIAANHSIIAEYRKHFIINLAEETATHIQPRCKPISNPPKRRWLEQLERCDRKTKTL